MALVKLDENVPDLVGVVLRSGGHDVRTAREENLSGSPDEKISEHAIRERRALLNLDKDFTDIRRHPPGQTPGIIVLRPHAPLPSSLRLLAESLSGFLSREELEGRLWVMDDHRLRIWPSVGGAPDAPSERSRPSTSEM